MYLWAEPGFSYYLATTSHFLYQTTANLPTPALDAGKASSLVLNKQSDNQRNKHQIVRSQIKTVEKVTNLVISRAIEASAGVGKKLKQFVEKKTCPLCEDWKNEPKPVPDKVKRSCCL